MRRLTISLVLLQTVSVAGVSAVLLGRTREALVPGELARQSALTQRLGTQLESYFRGARSDAQSVAGLGSVQHAVLDGPESLTELDAETRSVVAEDFAGIMRAKPGYLQLRLIDSASGHELVRVERSDVGEDVSRTRQLQDKSSRYYVQQALALKPDRTYLSPIDLNREHGELQEPHVPVLRVAAGLFARDGTQRAIVVLNVGVKPALDALHSPSADGTVVRLVNARGDYLVHEDAQKEFAFDVGGRANLLDDFSQLAGSLKSPAPTEREVRTPDGPLSAAVVPVRMEGRARLFVVTLGDDISGAAMREAERVVLPAALLTAGIAAALGFLLIRTWSRPLRQMTRAVESAGDPGAPPLPTSARAEVGTLARAMQKAQQLADSRLAEVQELATERKQQLTEIAAAEARLRMLLERVPVGVAMVRPSGEMITANGELERMLGYRPGELVGKNVDTLVPVERRGHHAEVRAEFFQSPRQRAMSDQRDLFGRRKDGGQVPVEVSLTPVPFEGRTVVLATVVDITERHRYEQAQNAHRKELERSNAALQEFAYVASHDLKEPLRMIASYTELLQQRYAGKFDERADRYIGYAADGAKRMQRLIADLLAYARLGTELPPLKPLALDEVLDTVLEDLQMAARDAGGEVTRDPLPEVLGDAVKLRQVLQNLVTNALKFHGDAPPRVHVGASLQSSRLVRISVRDNGVGIDPAQSERLFRMFQRSQHEAAGSGIGLAVAKQIVQGHGGDIWYESAPGQGTTFYFTLLAAPSHEDERAAES